jgi:hypothetical protein
VNPWFEGQVTSLSAPLMTAVRRKLTSRLLPTAIIDIDFILFLQRITMTGCTASSCASVLVSPITLAFFCHKCKNCNLSSIRKIINSSRCGCHASTASSASSFSKPHYVVIFFVTNAKIGICHQFAKLLTLRLNHYVG